jgi:hypothetical protein
LVATSEADLLGIAILGEALKIQHLAGRALIGLALLLIDGRLVRKTARS